jgi:hypothetical protein
MSKKQKYQRTPEPEDNLTYSQEMMAQQEQEPVEELDAEEESYKKRYTDIQRHIQTVKDQSSKQMQDMQKQLDEATRSQIKFPKTDQEVEAWSKRYPDVAKIVDTIAQKRANEVLREGEKRLEKVEQFERQIHKNTAEQKLLERHPDFAKIRESRKFHDWVSRQHPTVQDSVYKNNTDAEWAASTIDLYKAQTGTKTTKGAAESVGRTSYAAPVAKVRATFSESAVAKMSDKEFEKNQEAIQEALASGKFEYDVSGAAR